MVASFFLFLAARIEPNLAVIAWWLSFFGWFEFYAWIDLLTVFVAIMAPKGFLQKLYFVGELPAYLWIFNN